MSSDDVLAEIYTAAADEIECAIYHTGFRAGQELWGIIGRALYDLYGYPAAEAVARRVGVTQAQFWDADQSTATKTLRELAGDHEPLDLLRDTCTDHRILAARRVLAAAVGWPTSDRASLNRIAQEVARQNTRLKSENERLSAQLAAALAQRPGDMAVGYIADSSREAVVEGEE